ncbi:uncharacterized protein LOC115923339 [Strongylocentrotus purpuratus]|uniref:Uncharacterized protein n=1 Tax=Strongylocentrotus purpuratus TaxID=7668 RepID=A0A7M7NQJ3_STRPU|nr:uncharacterized protein LOC115923339 [Strongylocentrotus purpuratus]
MGSTYGLAAIILIILIYWITTQVRQHLSSKRQDPASQISHTTLDMTRPVQGSNADVRPAASARILAGSQEVAVGRVTIRTDSVLYETIPDVTIAGPSKRTEGEQNTEEGAVGYINHNPQPNWNKMATADGAWNP